MGVGTMPATIHRVLWTLLVSDLLTPPGPARPSCAEDPRWCFLWEDAGPGIGPWSPRTHPPRTSGRCPSLRPQTPVTWQLADAITRSVSHGGGHEVGPELRTGRGWSQSPGTSPLLLSQRVIHTQFPRRCQHRPQLTGRLGQACAVTQGWRCSSRQRCRDTRRCGREGEQAGGGTEEACRPGRVQRGVCRPGPLPQECLGGPQPQRAVGGRLHPTQPQAPFPT